MTIAAGLSVTTGGATIGGVLILSSGLTISAGGLNVMAGGATISGIVTALTGLTITTGGLLISAGGATVLSSGSNSFSTSAIATPAVIAASSVSSGYTGSVLSVSSQMTGSDAFFLVKVRLNVLFLLPSFSCSDWFCERRQICVFLIIFLFRI